MKQFPMIKKYLGLEIIKDSKPTVFGTKTVEYSDFFYVNAEVVEMILLSLSCRQKTESIILDPKEKPITLDGLTKEKLKQIQEVNAKTVMLSYYIFEKIKPLIPEIMSADHVRGINWGVEKACTALVHYLSQQDSFAVQTYKYEDLVEKKEYPKAYTTTFVTESVHNHVVSILNARAAKYDMSAQEYFRQVEHLKSELEKTLMEKSDLESKIKKLEKPRMFPIIREIKYEKPYPQSVAWSIAERAYGAYSSKYGTSQSLERLAERGGFYPSEMDIFYPDWLKDSSELAGLKAQVSGLQTRVVDAEAIAYRSDNRVRELEALVGTLRMLVGCETRNVSDISVEQHSKEIMAQINKGK